MHTQESLLHQLHQLGIDDQGTQPLQRFFPYITQAYNFDVNGKTIL